ncbi:hypothetical protein NUW58_g5146 [Xylaria curta]|uniref:Uncharacterized protein n=1 Tax=Xylaria curta TaxID=42375 RepID=A0ACC1P2Y9_9PEZI|nr:hypothetical protein NUW58_g5146 [Xylaria curta]
MSSSLLHPPSHLPPATALRHSKQAPSILDNSPGAPSASILQSVLSASETQELWTVYENLLLSCLRTGDDKSAQRSLDRLVNRFGDDNERVMALAGLVKEATAADDSALDLVLQEYEKILQENPSNLPITKRRAALLRAMNRTSEAVNALNSLLDMSPTDAEAWAELADLYLAQGLYSQAIFAQEEVLILQPNAWNIHARLGEILLMAAKTSDAAKRLTEALKRFCRSIELCDNYLRGYYGLKLTTSQLLSESFLKASKQTDSEEWPVPTVDTLRKLDETATEKLAEIVRRNSAGEKDWQGYGKAEIAAARELLESHAAVTTNFIDLTRDPASSLFHNVIHLSVMRTSIPFLDPAKFLRLLSILSELEVIGAKRFSFELNMVDGVLDQYYSGQSSRKCVGLNTDGREVVKPDSISAILKKIDKTKTAANVASELRKGLQDVMKDIVDNAMDTVVEAVVNKKLEDIVAKAVKTAMMKVDVAKKKMEDIVAEAVKAAIKEVDVQEQTRTGAEQAFEAGRLDTLVKDAMDAAKGGMTMLAAGGSRCSSDVSDYTVSGRKRRSGDNVSPVKTSTQKSPTQYKTKQQRINSPERQSKIPIPRHARLQLLKEGVMGSLWKKLMEAWIHNTTQNGPIKSQK